MAFVYDPATILSITTNIGNADATLQAEVNTLPSTYIIGTVSVSNTVVTGTGTTWQVSPFLSGARIGFGSTNPDLISTWYDVTVINTNTQITLLSSAGIIGSGSSYVLQQKRSGLKLGTENRLTVADCIADNNIVNADFDSSTILAQSMRTSENALSSTLSSVYASYQTALDTYVNANKSATVRNYYNSLSVERSVSFTENYRSFYRRIKSEELIVKLYSNTKSVGVWGSTVNHYSTTNMLATLLEVRTGSLIGASDVVVTLVPIKSDGTNDSPKTLNIPATTANKTQYAINDTTKYKGIFSIGITGGTNGDIIEVWIK
jgi:hypothetical protein